MKKLYLSGSQYEIGKQHGLKGKKQVHQSLQTYEKLFYGYGKISWNEAKNRALKHLDAIEKYDPELVEEMIGVADGAGVEFEDILALNTRSEIALTNNTYDGCTAVAFTDPFSSRTLLGQNWDWKSDQASSLVFLEINQKYKPNIHMVTEGGIIGKIGFNESRIGVCLNALLTNELDQNKIPIHLGLRAILNSHTLNEAIDKVDQNQMASAANFLLASHHQDGKGRAIDLEVSPIKTNQIESQHGVMIHTNHLCSADMKKVVTDFPLADSYQRLERAERLIESSNGIELIKMQEIFSDHVNFPNSICRHHDEDIEEHLQMDTLFSIIMDLSDLNVYIAEGHPCTASWSSIAVSDSSRSLPK